MPASVLWDLFYYSFVSCITPGPANLASLSTALRCGKKVALKQWWGQFTGFTIDSLIATGIIFFVGTAFTPYIRYFSFVGAFYIVYLGIHILRNSSAVQTEKSSPRKSAFIEGSFLFGLLLNLTNLKVIVFALTALAGYVLPYHTDFGTLLLFGCLLPFTAPMCNLVWLFCGVRLQGLFNRHRRLINILMALSLFYCAIKLVLQSFSF